MNGLNIVSTQVIPAKAGIQTYLTELLRRGDDNTVIRSNVVTIIELLITRIE